MTISRMTEEEKKIRDQKLNTKKEFQDAIGFRTVIDAMSRSRKPLIGHNLLLDLLHIYHQFCEPLPYSLDEWKTKILKLFPIIIDTKYLTAKHTQLNSLFPSTSLGDAHYSATSPPFDTVIEVAPSFEKYANGDSLHEAGYDAFITAVLFANLAHHLGKQESVDYPILPTHDLVVPFANKLNLMRSDAFLTLSGPDTIPDRSHVFHVSGFPPTTKTHDILEYFKKYGKLHINWIDDTSVFLVMDQHTFSLEVNQSILETEDYTVITCEEHQQKSQDTPRKRRLSKSSQTSEASEEQTSKKVKDD